MQYSLHDSPIYVFTLYAPLQKGNHVLWREKKSDELLGIVSQKKIEPLGAEGAEPRPDPRQACRNARGHAHVSKRRRIAAQAAAVRQRRGVPRPVERLATGRRE